MTMPYDFDDSTLPLRRPAQRLAHPAATPPETREEPSKLSAHWRHLFAAGALVAGFIYVPAITALIFVYFLPAFVAFLNRHHNTGAIFVLNLLLGWTLLGWIAALVWSCAKPARVEVVATVLPVATT